MDVDERGHCSKCGGTHYGTGRTCVFDQTFTLSPKWPKPKPDAADSMMHASAPPGHKCADCTIDGKACSDCVIAGLTKERDALRAALAQRVDDVTPRWPDLSAEVDALRADLRECAEALEEACAWGDNFPFCENGWRGESHEECIQQLEVYKAGIMRKAREWRAALTRLGVQEQKG